MRRAGSIIPLLLVSLSFAQDQTPKLDTGDTAWMIVATALVMLMTLPGLAMFYGGMAKRKDTLNTIAMSFVAYCIASVLWTLMALSLQVVSLFSVLAFVKARHFVIWLYPQTY